MVKAQTPKMFLKALRSATERCIHISAHGGREPKRGAMWANPFETRIYPTPYAPLWLTRPEEIEGLGPELWRNEKPELIVMVACETGHNDMAQAFLRTGVKYFFNTLFYYHYFVRRKSVPESFRETMKLKDLKRGWRLFPKE
jgi:CHAT domain-containing protein